MQWRKLFDFNPLFTVLSDKYAVRAFAADRMGYDCSPKLLWSGEDPSDIPFDELEPPYVIKPNHSSGRILHVDSVIDVDRTKIIETLREWLAISHGDDSIEPGYVNIPRRVIVERKLVLADGSPPLERKVYVFHGRAKCIATIVVNKETLNRGHAFHDTVWNELDWELIPFALLSIRRFLQPR